MPDKDDEKVNVYVGVLSFPVVVSITLLLPALKKGLVNHTGYITP